MFVVGVINSGMLFGGVIFGLIVGMIVVVFSWKVFFVFIMIIGLIWVVFWFKFVKEKLLVVMGDVLVIKVEMFSGEKILFIFYLK